MLDISHGHTSHPRRRRAPTSPPASYVSLSLCKAKMDSLEHEQSEEQPEETSCANGVSGEPSVLVRVGNHYQAKVPPLASDLASFQLRTGDMHGSDNYTETGLEIPIMWVRHTERRNKHGQENFPDTTAGDVAAGSVGLPCLQPRKVEGYSPLPCSPATPWTDAEAQSFLLALYFFGKNFFQVNKFIENKEMGDILSYYYGEFCRSDVRRRWLVCRKAKSRKCIYGRGIVTGWRQQELLSRLTPMMATDVLCRLQEATKTFNDDKDASLEDYVHTLKAAVGIQALVEAVAIGKGKRDLTGMAMEPVRKNQVSAHPEIPVGKECSSLTYRQIVQCLTANIRLSKARSNDLFWEAVWPRLLARGWHSEQPRHLSFVGSKHALVFLVPGVKKFSRKKLEKGTHYFDSVTDVLNQVAADPRIIELEDEGGRNTAKDDYGSDMDARLDQNGLPDHQGRCYLRPRLPDCITEPTKFTIVDTSLAQVEPPFKIWGPRSLPANIPSCFAQIGSEHSEEQESSTDNQLQDPGSGTSTDNKFVDSEDCLSGKARQSDRTDSTATAIVSERSIPVDAQVLDDDYLDLSSDKRLAKDIKHQFSRRRKSSQADSLVPSGYCQKLSSWSNGGMPDLTGSFPRGHQLKREERCVGPQVGSSQPSAQNSLDHIYDHVLTVDKTTITQEKRHPRVMIDLNLPVLPEFDAEPFGMEVVDSDDGLEQMDPASATDSRQFLVDSQITETSNDMLCDQQTSTSSRRQGTRNRPPTVKALEAFANGLIGTKRKGRGNDPYLPNTSKSRSSRRARRNVEPPALAHNTNPASFSSDVRELNARMDPWYTADGNSERMLGNSRGQSERNGIHELLGVP